MTIATEIADVYVQHEVEQWLYHEAALLDSRDYHAWLGLLSPRIRYYMPLQENRLERDRVRDDPGASLEVALFDDDYRFLEHRIARINTGVAWNEEPPPRTRRLVTNVRITVRVEAKEFLVNSNFLIKRNRLQDDEDQFAGGRRDVLVRDEDASLKLTDRRIELDQSVVLTKSFSLLF